MFNINEYLNVRKLRYTGCYIGSWVSVGCPLGWFELDYRTVLATPGIKTHSGG